MPQDPLPTEQQIEEAVKDLHDAMLENIKASNAEKKAVLRKQHARQKLLGAKGRLSSLETDLMAL